MPSHGLAYLPTASYTEMEAWSLPPDAALRLARLQRDLGEARVAGPDGALIRGAHWRNFLVKYSESNRMHKKMQALSALCRRKGDPAGARRAIGRAQCNDAYWHGVFGGLYLPHLRDAVWRELALAEGELRRGKGLAWEVLDFDGDGYQEIWVHSESFSALVSPSARRRHRGVHRVPERHQLRQRAHPPAGGLPRPGAGARRGRGGSTGTSGTASIHDHRGGHPADARPPLDAEDRALFVERILPGSLGLEEYAGGDYRPARSWARTAFEYAVRRRRGGLEIACATGEGPERLAKMIRFEGDGEITVRYAWDPGAAAPDDLFATEISLAATLEPETTPAAEIVAIRRSRRSRNRSADSTARGRANLSRSDGRSASVRQPWCFGRPV